jgi:ABC-type glycerol-3-phosphate transport system substrate-binding protein
MVLFDIMTGLERLVHIYSGSNQVLRRYLTLFYGFTLGLALVLAFIAIGQRGNVTSETATITQAALDQTASPTLGSTPVHRLSKPTSLPAIPPTPNEETPSALGVTGAELRGVQVSLWHPWTGSTGAALQTILDEFNRTNQWGITVQASAYEGFGRLDEAMESAVISGTLPDVLVDYGYQAQHWDGSGVVTDLTPYVNDPIWGLSSAEQADFYPDFWAEDLVAYNSTSQDKRLGIPFYRSAYVLFYNQSWAKELGFPNPPATPDDFKLQACTATVSTAAQSDKSDLGRGGWLITPQPGALVGWIYTFGGGITNPGAPGYLFNTPETRQAFEYIKGLQESGCAWSETGVEPQKEFANRQALFVVGSLFDIPAQQEAFIQAGSADEWVVIPFPSNSQTVVDTYGPSLLTTRSSPAQQLAAWLVVEWLVYPPNMAKWVKELETYPTRQSTLNYLNETASASPQWGEALELLPDTRSEPSLASWSVMRWALNDVMAQLIDPQFSVDQIPSLLENLDIVASEIFNQVH